MKMIKCKNGGCPKGKDICCLSCEDLEGCKDNGACDLIPGEDFEGTCPDAVVEGSTELEVFETKSAAIIQSIADIVTQKKDLEEKEKTMKAQLQKAMEQHGIKSFNNEVIKITYIAATTANSVDSKKLKEKYPEIASECSKVSNKSAYVKVEVK